MGADSGIGGWKSASGGITALPATADSSGAGTFDSKSIRKANSPLGAGGGGPWRGQARGCARRQRPILPMPLLAACSSGGAGSAETAPFHGAARHANRREDFFNLSCSSGLTATLRAESTEVVAVDAIFQRSFLRFLCRSTSSSSSAGSSGRAGVRWTEDEPGIVVTS